MYEFVSLKKKKKIIAIILLLPRQKKISVAKSVQYPHDKLLHLLF